MTYVISITKGNGGMPIQQVIDNFLMFNELDAIKNAVEQADERVFLAWSTVNTRDKEGERIPIDQVIADQDILLKRGGPLTDSHTNAVVGRTLAYKVMRHPVANELGVLHLNQIFSDNKLDDQVWEETVSGERTGLSVGGTIDTPEKIGFEPTNDGLMTRVLNGFRQYETASVHNPANQWALNEAVSLVAKSADGKIVTNEISKNERGESVMDAETKEKFNAMADTVAKLAESVDNLTKTKTDEEDLLGKQGSQEPKKEDEESPAKETVAEEPKKEEAEKASAPLEGSGSGAQPKSPIQDENNDVDAYKEDKEDDETKKELEALKAEMETLKGNLTKQSEVIKAVNSRPNTYESQMIQVNKARTDARQLAIDIALGKRPEFATKSGKHSQINWGVLENAVEGLYNTAFNQNA